MTLGSNLNESLDNIFFTRLFKNPQWKSSADPTQYQKRFSVFKKILTGEKLSTSEILLFVKAGLNNKTFPMSYYQVYHSLKQFLSPRETHTVCGWKEPNTQVYIDQIAKYFPNIKYVQVIRNGIEMAFSSNKQQLKNWAHLFGIENEKKTI